jgi:bifunctional ADP-heptose synthase (sugar kinase/adenylyltransferase)
MAEPNCLVVGDVFLDVACSVVPRDNAEGSAACYTGNTWTYLAGGAANVAAILRASGASVTLVGAVGKDWASLELEALLEGVTLDLQRALPTTTVKLRAVVEGEDAAAVRIDREVRRLEKPMRYPAGMHKYDCVILSDYGKGIFEAYGPSDEWFRRVVVTTADCPVVVDPHPHPGQAPLDWTGALLATPNVSEWAALGNVGTEWTAVTRGAKGCELRDSEGVVKMKFPCPRKVVHPQVVGAGDSFTAACGLALAGGMSVTDSVEVAVAFATEYVGRPRAHGGK